MSAVTQVTISESVTDLTAENTNAVTVNITAEDTTISVNNFAIPINFMDLPENHVYRDETFRMQRWLDP